MQTMHETITKAAALIPDQNSQKTLTDYISRPKIQQRTEIVQHFFDSLTTGTIPPEQCNKFCHNWSQIHLSSQSVSGLIVRLLSEGENAQGFRRDNYFLAAAQMGHVIVEDTGVQGPSHHRMYDLFAQTITGGDDWKRDRFQMEETGKFRQYVEKSRTKDPYETAILTTFASEIMNTAEYTYANQKMMPWMVKHQEIPPTDARRAIAYVHVHAGETELDHAQHAYKAWKHWNTAERRQPNPQNLVRAFDTYLEQYSNIYSALTNELGLSPVNSNDNTPAPVTTGRVYNWVVPSMG